MITLNREGRYYRFMTPIDMKLSSYIDKILSYTKKNTHFMKNPLWGIVHMYSVKRRAFPVGLLSRVRPILDEWCKQKGEQYTISNTSPLETFQVQTSNLRDYQVEALKTALKYKGGLINIPVGGGKTKLGERLLASYGHNNKKLVLVPTQEIKKQWLDEVGDILHIFKLHIETYQKAYRDIQTDFGRKRYQDYDVVIMDEVHRVAARTFYKVGMSLSKADIYGLTGTKNREDGEDMKVEAIVGPVIYEVPIQKLVKDGHIVQAKVNMIRLNKYKASPIEDWRDIYNNGVVRNEERNNKIIEIALREMKKGMCLILFDSLEHGNILYQKVCESSLPYTKFVYIEGKTNNRPELFEVIKTQSYNLILASRVFNEGLNLPNLRTLILASGGQSAVRIVQQIGRSLRNSEGKEFANVYDFLDDGKILKRHTQKRLKIYETNGFEVSYE